MIVYADILVLLNIAVDYFLLALTARLLKTGTRLLRQLAAAIFGGFCSLSIFLPELGSFGTLFLQIGVSALLTLIAFGFGSGKRWLRSLAVLLCVSFGYAGAMFAIWQFFRPNGLLIHNSVVYLNISPLFLILFSVAAYFIVLLLRSLLDKNSSAAHCEIRISLRDETLHCTAIADTGNSLEDSFGVSEVIIADPAAVESLIHKIPTAELKRRYRLLPCSTVSGSQLLEGYRCDKAYLTYSGKTTELTRPILAISQTPIRGDFSAIINPKILE